MKKVTGWPAIITILASFITWVFGAEVRPFLPPALATEEMKDLSMMLLTVVAAYLKKPAVITKTEEEPPRRF